MFSKEEIKNLISIVHEYSCLSCKKLLDDYPILKNFSSVDSFDQLLTSLNYELDKKEYYEEEEEEEEEDRKLLQQLKNEVYTLTSDMFSDKIEELKKDYPILGAEEFKECKNPEDYLEKLNTEFEKLNKESSQKKKCTTSLHR